MSDRFEFIDAEHASSNSGLEPAPPIGRMCVLLEVSRSGFYEWRGRPALATAQRRDRLMLVVRKSFEDSNGTYGYRRVHADLVGWGVPAGAGAGPGADAAGGPGAVPAAAVAA